MIQYITAKEAGEKWNISQRRVSALCAENRIPDVAMLGNMWIIPRDAEKPDDARKLKTQKHIDYAHPFIKWAGGKGQLLDVLHENMPENMDTIKKYAEPFVGGGALLFSMLNKYDFDEVFISDNNKELMNAYQVIKSNCHELIEKLGAMEKRYHSLPDEKQKQLFYYEQREKFNSLSLNNQNCTDKAVLFIFLNKTCFNGLYRVNRNGKFNVPFGKHDKPTICDKDNILKISELLENVIIKSCDYKEMFVFADASTLVYFDPPYRPLNSTSAFTSYTENQFTDKEQIELADFYKKLSATGAKLMLSNSDPHNVDEDDNFFDNLYSDFSINRVNATRMINSKANGRGKIKELLIKNY